MPSTQRRARIELTGALKRTLAPEVAALFIGGTHTRRLADNLLPGLSQQQIATLREQLASGAGGELRPTRTGKRPAHAPYSSAALAVNAFGRWLGAEEHLPIAGLLGQSAPLTVESRHRIPHGGGEANLDCLLRGPATVVGIESKLTETLAAHAPVPWRPAYDHPRIRALLTGGWRDVLDASRAGTWRPAHLGVEQLVKHALALAASFPRDQLHLVYVWWEPLNPDAIPEIVAHRTEVAELRARVGDATPRLHALSYTDLLAQWERLDRPAWVTEHVSQLRARYAIALPTA